MSASLRPQIRHQNEKATRYISSLNTARCDGNWSELPELIRKVTKHAPQRKCLIQTATAEHRAAIYAGSVRPGTPAKGGGGDLSSLIPSLLSSREVGNDPTDVFEAEACLIWIHWLLKEPDLAISRAPRNTLLPAEKPPQSEASSSQWTDICRQRSAYIKAASLEATGQTSDSIRTLQATSPTIKHHAARIQTCPQLAYWSEQSLAELAALASGSAKDDSSNEVALESFRLWASISTRTKEVSGAKYGNIKTHGGRLSTWRRYYKLVSANLGQTTTTSADPSSSTRMKQAAELRRVEAQYETELLKTTQFPKVTDSNKVVEEWVEQIIQNWSILCGPQWHDHEHGAGGRNAVGRNVLDILYRAASKTFHSTLILRRLFQVHKSLTDFDLAYKALDTYIELIERDRARAAKDGEDAVEESGQDGHEVVFRTISEGIEGLCGYGRRSEAKRAYELASKLEDWLLRLSPDSSRAALVNGHPNGKVDGIAAHKTVLSRETIGLTCRAIGIAQAHWAKWSPFSENRASLQAEAVSNLAYATTLLKGDTQFHIEATYALALLLAETREIDRAIEFVKAGLDSHTGQMDSDSGYAQERRKLPLWHLLALLLTARQDFDTATQSCNAAFEQFRSSSVLLGSGMIRSSDVRLINEKGSFDDISQRGVVDDMECAELQRIIEIRITELALTELMDGPEDAVNSSNELLALYYRLFGHLDVGTADPVVRKDLAPPQSSSNTVRSFRGSLFGRKKQSTLDDSFSEKRNGAPSSIAGRSTRPTTQATEAPTIKITDQDEKDIPARSHRFRKSGDHSRGEKSASQKLHRREGSITSAIRRRSQEKQERKSLASTHKQSVETSRGEGTLNNPRPQTNAAHDPEKPPVEPEHGIDEVPAPSTSLTHESSPEAKQSQPPTDHSTDSNNPTTAPNATDLEPLEKRDIRHPTLHTTPPTLTLPSPTPHFSPSASQRHALTVLVKIWLVIAKLYRRASLFDDSREACDEAAKAAAKIESLVATGVESSARAFADPGWGGAGGKSSDEIWADVFCERGELALAVGAAAAVAGDATTLTTDGKSEAGGNSASGGDAGVREAVEQFEQCLMYYPDHPGGIVGLSNVLLDNYEKKIELGRRVDDGRPKSDAVAAATRLRRPSSPVAVVIVSQQQNANGNGDIGAAGGGGGSDERRHPGSFSSDEQNEEDSEDASTQQLQTQPQTQPHNPLPSTSVNANASASASANTASASASTEDDSSSSSATLLRKTPENLNRLAARDRAYGLLSSLTKLGTAWDDSEAWFALARAHELGSSSSAAAGAGSGAGAGGVGRESGGGAAAVGGGSRAGAGETDEVKKTREILWWCVELEDQRPVRHWRNVNGDGGGGYVL